jgi:hypothetical protein
MAGVYEWLREAGSCRDALCTADNVAVRNGALTLASRNVPTEGYNFTTGAVNTKGKQVFSYDPAYRLCVGSMLPGGGGPGSGQGIWPA